uniref:Ground-like domain-containing protein n=1 Tax=Parascaris univalens TaxID=6257 RepID=A0A915ACQ6_PARUN
MMAILFVCALLITPTLACLGGGQACCPAASTSCAPAMPRCPLPSYGGGCSGGGCGPGGAGGIGGPVGGIGSIGPIGGVGAGGKYAAPPIGLSNIAPAPSYSGPPHGLSNIAPAPSYSGPPPGLSNIAPVPSYSGPVPGLSNIASSSSYSGPAPSLPNVAPASSYSNAGPGPGYLQSGPPTGFQNAPATGYGESGPGLSASNGPPSNINGLPMGASGPQPSYNDNIPSPAASAPEAPLGQQAPAPAPAQFPETEYQQSQSDNAYEEISSDHDKAPDAEASMGTYEKGGGPAPAPLPAPAPSPAPLAPQNQALNSEAGGPYETASQIAGPESNYEESNVAPVVPATSQTGDYNEENNAAIEPVNVNAEGATCEDPELRAIVENALSSESDNLEAARKIEGNASKKFGGRFNSIVSDSEFAYVNWYGKRNCQLRVLNRHSLTWED